MATDLSHIHPALREFFAVPRVVLAPMAGITDPSFRSLCREYGAELAFTEMVSAKALDFRNARTEGMLELAPDETAVSVQLFGHEPDVLAREAARVEQALGERLFSININMGCPARKISSKGDGAALMKDPALAAQIISACKQAVSVPVTAKFRRGFAEHDETCVEFAHALEDAGADALCVHGRYAAQLYRGSAEWTCIARVKDAVRVPVVGNGDITSGEAARAMIEITGCDAVMVARAAEGHPWIFSEIRAALSPLRGEDAPVYTAPDVRERMAVATRHARALCALPEGGVRMRRLAMHYVAGLPGAREARSKLCACTSAEEFEAVFLEVVEHAS